MDRVENNLFKTDNNSVNNKKKGKKVVKLKKKNVV